MRSFYRKLLFLSVSLSVGGSAYQLGGCVSNIPNQLFQLNPCGTILSCDPAEYAFITAGYDGPGVNANVDPFCTFPPFCSAAVDPVFGGLVTP